MIVNESGLLAAMKASYKAGGYHVAVGTVFAKKCYVIAGYGYGWAVVIRQTKMPRKVLGLLAEHIGRLPDNEEAFLCRKDNDAQDEIFDVAAMPVLNMLGEAQSTNLPTVRKTRLVWDGADVWQLTDCRSESDAILMRPDLEKIVIFKDTFPKMVGKYLYISGGVSEVMIHQITPGETDKEMVANIGQHHWI